MSDSFFLLKGTYRKGMRMETHALSQPPKPLLFWGGTQTSSRMFRVVLHSC